MNKIIALILILMCFGRTYAQNTFYRSYDNPYSNTPRDLIETEDSYYVCGEFSLYGGDGSNAFLMRINKDGSPIWTKSIDKAYRERYNSLIDVGDGFIAGGRRVIDSKNYNLLTKYDYDGNEIWDIHLGDTATLGFDNIINELLLVEDGILVGSSAFDSVSMTTNGALYKIDFEGDILWKQNFGDDLIEARIDRVMKVEEMSDAYLLSLLSLNIDFTQFSTLIKVDQNGNEIWRKPLKHYQSTTTESDTLIRFTDVCVYKQNNILTHFTRFDLDTYSSSHILIEFDSDGNEVEFTEYPLGAATVRANILCNADDEIFLSGQQDWDTVGNFYAELFATKFDCNKNLIWENHYGSVDQNDSQLSAIIASDGGLLIGGYFFNITTGVPFGYNSILVKTDCRGQLDWDHESCIDPETTQDVLVFPNPFQEHVNVHLPNIPKENEIGIQIYDLKGSLIENFYFEDSRTCKLEIDRFSSGFYVVKIFVDGVIYHSEKVVKY